MEKKEIIKILKQGGIGILPTDTVYGLVGLASSPKAVKNVFQAKGRDENKALIILVSSLRELSLFGIALPEEEKKWLAKVWPGKVSVILSCPQKKFEYLHRGQKTLAFRLPKNKFLQELIKKTGPLVAPSANPEGQPTAQTITEAKKYFSGNVGFYVSAGHKLASQPSTLVALQEGKFKILRQGAGRLPR